MDDEQNSAEKATDFRYAACIIPNWELNWRIHVGQLPSQTSFGSTAFSVLKMLALPLAAAALLGFFGRPMPQLTSVRRFVPSGASVSSCTFRLPVACPTAKRRIARTPAVAAKVGGYASEADEPIVPAPPGPLVLDATTKKQLAIIVSTSFLVQMGVGMGIIVLPVFAQSLGLGQLGVSHTGLEPY